MPFLFSSIYIFKFHYEKPYIIIYFFYFPEPTDAGIIPPQFRKPHHVPSVSNTAANHIPVETNSAPEKKMPHQWSSNPVEEWAKEQVKMTQITVILQIVSSLQ
jgi:hypothetical protein